MSEEIEDAVVVGEEVNMQEVIDQSRVTAEALLETNGWAILKELYIALSSSINATSLVVIPAMQRKDEICAKISDPEAFSKIMHNVVIDISGVATALRVLGEAHLGKSADPVLDSDVETIADISMQYSKLQTQMDTVIHPLLMSVIDVLQEADVDTELFLTEAN